MKRLAVASCVCGLVLAGGANALEVGSGHEASFYYSHPLGSAKSTEQPPSFGFRVDYARTRAETPTSTSIRVSRMPLMNLRMIGGHAQRVDLGGVPVMHAGTGSMGGSAGALGMSAGGLIIGSAIVGAGVLCLAEHWICEDDDSSYSSSGGGSEPIPTVE